jgi:pyruvate/2-oxoglutarate dehydrogenase complex dihydrolipoamide acyltransferase (E2) component
MPLDVVMPALGMAQETGLIVAWHKQSGDPVAKGDALFEVETDKATMEVEAQGDGFLTNVTAYAGTDVPVGHVIAKISQSAESIVNPVGNTVEVSAAHPALAADLPEGKEVIMPTLGMAQDTGLLVSWHKTAGDAVDADEILFEVETDKSTVEVNAGTDGYIAALLVGEGEEVPVGQTIAIISIDAPVNPITCKAADAPVATTSDVTPNAATEAPTIPKPVHTKIAPRPHSGTNGRILASPKARRLAHEQGLDLARLVAAGHPQPFHVRDLAILKALPAEAKPASHAAPAASRLTAEVATEGFSAFAVWARETANLTDTSALLAGFCAASMQTDAIVAVESFNSTKAYAGTAQLSSVELSEDPPQIRLRDLRFTTITTVQVGAEDVPTLTLTRNGVGVSITLEFASGQLSAPGAITLLSNFAGRIEHPLRHLL